MSIVTVRSKVVTTLAEWAASKTPAIVIVREGQALSTLPANNGTYIEVAIVPADTKLPTIDATKKRYVGDVVCNIYSKEGIGTALSEGLAEELAALFPVYPKTLLPVSIETVPCIKKAFPLTNGYRITPVTFSYRAEF